MSWATHVKIQNLGLADTSSPSGKKWYQIPKRTGLKRGPAARVKKHIRSDFFLQWMALDSVFYLPLHHTTCIFSLPVRRGGLAAHLLGGPTYRNHHSIFHQAPKKPGAILLRKKVCRWHPHVTYPTVGILTSSHTNTTEKGKHSYQTQVHRTRSYS